MLHTSRLMCVYEGRLFTLMQIFPSVTKAWHRIKFFECKRLTALQCIDQSRIADLTSSSMAKSIRSMNEEGSNRLKKASKIHAEHHFVGYFAYRTPLFGFCRSAIWSDKP